MNVPRRRFLTAGMTAAAGAATAGPLDWLKPVFPELFPGTEPEGPFEAPAGTEIDPIVRILNRAGFGPRPEDYGRVRALAPEPGEAVHLYIEEQLRPDEIDDAEAERLVRRLEPLAAPPGELFEYKERFLLEQMTRGAVLRAVYSRRQLYEAMVQFWTDHFNIDSSKGDCRWLKAADDRDVIRAGALGMFPELLRASALSPAMLWYLDGRVNRKDKPEDRPNENYARELLELHTLGVRGGYTQDDVMEAARCLTGWTVRSEERFNKGKVEFHPERHDNGPKRVLGVEIPAGLGERDLDRLLEIATGHPATARHLAFKLCRRFIADEPPPEAVEAVGEVFASSGGDIPATLRALFARPEFFDPALSKFKRPFEFIVSALRATGARTDGGAPIMDYLLRMGHAPFQYPTPDGYPSEAAPWMGTLLWRWNFAAALTANQIPGTRVNLVKLRGEFRGEKGLLRHLAGRLPSPEEYAAAEASGAGPALILASPGFQRT